MEAEQITFRLPSVLAEQLRLKAKAEDRSVAYMVRRAIRRLVADQAVPDVEPEAPGIERITTLWARVGDRDLFVAAYPVGLSEGPRVDLYDEARAADEEFFTSSLNDTDVPDFFTEIAFVSRPVITVEAAA